jgi:hypothetical protein
MPDYNRNKNICVRTLLLSQLGEIVNKSDKWLNLKPRKIQIIAKRQSMPCCKEEKTINQSKKKIGFIFMGYNFGKNCDLPVRECQKVENPCPRPFGIDRLQR